jgi:hypothetical protein
MLQFDNIIQQKKNKAVSLNIKIINIVLIFNCKKINLMNIFPIINNYMFISSLNKVRLNNVNLFILNF